MPKLVMNILHGTVAVVCLATLATADPVNMQLTSVGSTVMGGSYVGPYTATANGVTTTVVSDDFAAHTYVNETWTANAYSFSDLSQTRWKNQPLYKQKYYAAASLTLQLLSTPQPATRGIISYAIWSLFTPTALLNLSVTNAIQAGALAANALLQTYNPNQFANFVVYTPISGTAKCNGEPCKISKPEEFLAVRTPEPSAVALLALNVFALSALLIVLRKRIVRV